MFAVLFPIEAIGVKIAAEILSPLTRPGTHFSNCALLGRYTSTRVLTLDIPSVKIN